MRTLALVALLGSYGALGAVLFAPEPEPPAARTAMAAPPVAAAPRAARPAPPARVAAPRRAPRIVWRHSTALGRPDAGRLVGAVRLPARGAHFATWDPARKRSPNRWWRRNGTDRLVRVLLRVIRAYAAAHPHAPRVLVGDLSRPHGGDFGRRFGPLGHVSHQNGLDADVYFPRRDRRLRAARSVDQVDRTLAQDLIDRFVRAGAVKIFVGAALRLRGPAGVVGPWPHHDDHLHVRLGARD